MSFIYSHQQPVDGCARAAGQVLGDDDGSVLPVEDVSARADKRVEDKHGGEGPDESRAETRGLRG